MALQMPTSGIPSRLVAAAQPTSINGRLRGTLPPRCMVRVGVGCKFGYFSKPAPVIDKFEVRRPARTGEVAECMVRRPTAREKRRVDRQVCANVFGLCVERRKLLAMMSCAACSS